MDEAVGHPGNDHQQGKPVEYGNCNIQGRLERTDPMPGACPQESIQEKQDEKEVECSCVFWECLLLMVVCVWVMMIWRWFITPCKWDQKFLFIEL